MSYKSNKEINEELDTELVPLLEYFNCRDYKDETFGKIRYTQDREELFSKVSQIRQNDLKGLVEWAESWKYQYDNYPTMMETKKSFEKGEIARELVADFIIHLSSLNQVNE